MVPSYAANSPANSLAEKAASLATGAIATVNRRKDEMVAAASNALARVTGADGDFGETEDVGNYDYYYDDDSAAYTDYDTDVKQYQGKFSDYGYTYAGAKSEPSVIVYPNYDYQDSIPVRTAPQVPKVSTAGRAWSFM